RARELRDGQHESRFRVDFGAVPARRRTVLARDLELGARTAADDRGRSADLHAVVLAEERHVAHVEVAIAIEEALAFLLQELEDLALRRRELRRDQTIGIDREAAVPVRRDALRIDQRLRNAR